MPFYNRVRLPFYLSKAQFPSERNIFPLADGSRKVQSIVVRKTYQLETNYIPENIHQRLVVALSHDTVNIEGDRYLGGVSIDSEYEINWEAFQDLPVAKGAAKLQVTPFDATNSNCQTCDNAAQIDLVDDTFPSAVNEGVTAVINAFTNDSILCFPTVASITTFNPTYVVSASIAADGTITIVMKNPVPADNGVNLLTYRVTCPDGSYDEADVFANVNGSLVVCGQPSALVSSAVTETTMTISWTAPGSAPGGGYDWEIYDCANPGTPVQTGNSGTTSVNLTGLNPATCYNFYVRSNCGGGSVSAYIPLQVLTSTPAGAQTCGLYELTWNDGSGDATHVNSCTILSCSTVYYNFPLYNMVPRLVCCQQHSPGNPVDIIGATSIIYQGLCP